MYDYDKINKKMDEKMPKGEPKKEVKYVGSLLFFLHLCLMFGMFWVGVALPVPVVWAVIVVYGLIFAVSASIHQNGSTGKAILMTLGSFFLGIFLLFATCVSLLSNIH